MVIDAAVVGLPFDRGVGHDHAPAGRCRQPRALGVGGQQHRSQGGIAEQTSAFVDAQQRLRAAVDADHLVGRAEIGRARVAGTRDPVNLDRRETWPQAAVADESVHDSRADGLAELGHLLQSR